VSDRLVPFPPLPLLSLTGGTLLTPFFHDSAATQRLALLDNMGNYMDKSRGMVGKVSSYFNKVLKENRHRRYMYYVVGLVIFFLVLYRWMFSRG